MSSPEEIQRDIERTRATLSADVDRLNEKVSPSRVVGRRVDQIKGTATSVKERVMGTAEDSSGLRGAGDSVSSGASSAKEAVSSAAASIGDAASAAPQTLRRQTQGNPLAAGLIAFGVGWLLSSLPPATQREQDVAKLAQDKAGDLAQPLKEKAQEVASNLQQPLQDSVEQVKSAATEAATQTADQAKSAAADVKEPLQP
jgi:methyl-accepting chemotaxis protein